MARILVTGTSTGVGRVAAIELAARGHAVVATARRSETLADIPVDQRVALDVTDQASVDAALAQAGEIDVLVANAGETLFGSVERTPVDEFERMFRLNALGALRVTQGVLAGMRERNHGRIVFVSSIAGRVAIPLGSAYVASKWALEGIAETLAVELSRTDIHVSLVEPGAIAGIGRTKAPQHRDEIDAYAPLWAQADGMANGDGTPTEEIARVIADTIERDDPPLRVPADPGVEGLLRALDASDRFALPFDITALQA